MEKQDQAVYRLYILQWLQDTKLANLSFQDHYEKFLKSIRLNKGLDVVYDSQAAQDIYSLMKDIKYYRFSKSVEQYKKQKGYQLAKITHFLRQKNFIKKRQKTKIVKFTDNNHLEGKFQMLIKAIQQQILKQKSLLIQGNNVIQRQDQILIQNWQKYIPFKLSQFWVHIEKKQQRKHSIVKKAYHLYSHLIINKVDKNPKPQQKMENQRPETHLSFKYQKDLSVVLWEIAQKNDLFRDSYSLNSIYEQLGRVKQIIKTSCQIKVSSIEDYGSIQSKLALRYRSDYDIVVFTKEPLSPKREEFLLYNIKKQVQTNLPYKKSFVICNQRTLLKTVTLKSQQFNSDSNKVDKIDVAINNSHGVNNSRFLRKLSKHQDARTFLLILKLWAKKNDLIKTYRFSSYGIVLMGIFYMMYHKQIDFMESQIEDFDQKDCPLPNVTFYDEQFPDLLTQFKQFLLFYSEQGEFFKQNLVVKLYKQSECQINQRFLINMVDPLNKTNPGRFKKNQRATFFSIITSSLAIIEQGDYVELMKLFIANPKNTF